MDLPRVINFVVIDDENDNKADYDIFIPYGDASAWERFRKPQRLFGMAKKNVVPLPFSESTQIRPP